VTTRRKGGPRTRPEQPQRGRDLGRIVATAAVCAVLAGTSLAVDTTAGAAFDAPKRLIALAGAAVAAGAVFGWPGRRGGPAPFPVLWSRAPRLARTALVLALAALLGAFLAALASPRREVSLSTMRALVLLVLYLPIGASRVFPRGRTALAATFLAAALVNAGGSLLQSRGWYRPFRLETFGGRQETGAFAGNVGYLAITLALAGVLALGLVLTGRRTAVRVAAGAALATFATSLAVNRNLTALTALVAGSSVLLVSLYRKRSAIPIAAVVAAAILAAAAYAPLRNRVKELSRAVRVADWDALVSFRGGPWAAAVEMTRERPVTGFGPGTFEAEYIPHRLAAEIRLRRRFVSPLLTSSYAEAHCDYLQVFCDAGIPVGLLALASAGCLLGSLGLAAWRGRGAEPVVLLALLVAGGAAALTWFPFQRPITAVPLLLAAGRAFAVSAGSASAHAPDGEEP
jgi:O-antigen ligase